MNVQHSDWDQVFEEVEREIHELLVGQALQIEKAFQLNSHKLEVALKVGLEDGDGGFGVSVDINFVKERIKTGTRKSLVLGQIDLPGFTAKKAQPSPRPVVDESRMLGAGAPQLEAGEPLHMGAGEGARRSCLTCRHCEDGCEHPDGSEETCSAPTYALYEQDDEERVGEEVDPHPFACGDSMRIQDVEGRLAKVREMDAIELRRVISWTGIQKSVVQAAARRLRKLEKEAAAKPRACANCQNNLPGGCNLEGECDNTYSMWEAVGAA